jgi:hypothetical protein
MTPYFREAFGLDDDDPPVHIDVERMKRALAGPRFEIPPGLTAEQIRRFILDVAASTKTAERP